MSLDEKIINEIARYNSINKYVMEQEAPPLPTDLGVEPPIPGELPAEGGVPSPPVAPAEATPVDLETDQDVEAIPEEGEEGEDEGIEELDITDLVDSQKTMSDKQEEYFTNLFDQITKMEEKLSEMDSIVSKIDNLDSKLEKYRPKTPQEKLELRSLDSGPYKQNLADFFDEKKDEMEASGKNEYVLTKDDVENYSPSDIEQTFNEPMEDEDNILLNRFNA